MKQSGIGTVKKGVFKHLSKKGLNNSDGLEMKDKSVLASKYYQPFQSIRRKNLTSLERHLDH